MKNLTKALLSIFCVVILTAVGFSGVVNEIENNQEEIVDDKQNIIENNQEEIEEENNIKISGTRSDGGGQSTENNTGYKPWYYYIDGMVNPANGNLFYSMNDLSIRGRGFNIGIIKSYNSLRSSTDSKFGYGWTYNYAISLDNYGDYVIETDRDGSEHNFTSLSGDYYTSPAGVNSRLGKYSNGGHILRVKNGNDYNFELDYDEYSADTNTTGLYHLNTGNGNTASDSSGNGNDGTIGGASWTSYSRFGSYALDFDGNDDYIDFGDVFDLPSGAIEMWFNLSNNFDSSSNSDMILFSKYAKLQGKEYSVRLKFEADDGKIYFVITNQDIGYSIYSDSASWISNTWYHVAATWGSNGMKMYINNIQQQDTDAYTGYWEDINSNAYVGARKDGANYEDEFDGLIDEIRVSDLQRTDFLDVFDNPAILTKITDKNGNKLTFTYSSGNLVNITDDSGLYIKIDYNLFGTNKISKVTDNSNRQVTYNYDISDNLVNVTDSAGNKTYYQYTNKKLQRIINRVNNAMNFTYYTSGDALGRVKEIWNSMYNESTDSYYNIFRENLIIYDIANSIVNVTNARGYESTIKMNQYGNPVELSQIGGSSSTNMSWEGNYLVGRTDSNNNTHNYEYDDYGNLIVITDPLEQVETKTYSTTLTSSDYISVVSSNINYEIENNTYDFEDSDENWDHDGSLEDEWECGTPTTPPSPPSAHSGYNCWGTDLDGNYADNADIWLQSPTYNVTYMDTSEHTIDVEYWLYYEFADVGDDDEGYCNITVNYGNFPSPSHPATEIYTFIFEDNDGKEGDWYHYYVTTKYNVINISIKFGLKSDSSNNAIGMYVDDVSIIGPSNKIKTTFGYDSNNNLNRTTDALGNSTYYNYDSYGNMVNSTDFRGNTTFYTYNPNGYLMKVTDALGNNTKYTYDSIGRQTSVNDSRGYNSTYTYDDLGRVTKITDPTGNTTTYTYFEDTNKRKSVIDANGHTTTNKMNWSVGKIEEATDALGNKTTYFYDKVGNLVKITDARGNNTTYEYDSLNRKVKETDAKGNYTTYTYDENGNLINITDKRGYSTLYEYDNLNRQIKIIDANGKITTTAYDFNGNKLNETNARGHTTHYHYDDLNRLICVEDATGNNTNYTYDENGNQITVTDPNGNTITYTFDALNRKIKVTYPLNHNTTYEYDAAGNLINTTDANGNYATNEYDSLNRKTKETNALGGVIIYEYDAAGNLLNITDENGNKTKQKYDALNRLINITSPLGFSTFFKYDANGNLINRTDANGNTTLYTYDELNRLIKTTYPDTNYISISHDANGNVKQRKNNGIGIGDISNYTYNELNRIKSVEVNYGSFSKTINYTYDEIGNIKTTLDPNGNTITYTYDVVNRLIQVTDQDNEKINFTYDNAGRRIMVQYPNGVNTTYTYDNANILINISNKKSDNTFLSSYEYTYDNVGNRLNVTDNNDNVREYAYDALYRLTNVTYPSGTTTNYTYDAGGNRLTMEINGATTSYTYDNDNRMTSDGTYSYSYGNNGNLLRKYNATLSTHYHYDYENRLTGVILPNSSWVTYNYSTEGNRLNINNNGNAIYYVYNYEDILMELNISGNQRAIFTHGPEIDEPIKMNRSSNKYYYHFDGLGSVTSLTDSNENIVATYEYDVFGDILSETGSVNNPYKFTSREYDNAIGLYYYRARYYDQASGRFLQKDPIGMKAGTNLFCYVKNNPVNNFDPFGLQSLQFENPSFNYEIDNNFYENYYEIPGLPHAPLFQGEYDLGTVYIEGNAVQIRPNKEDSGTLVVTAESPRVQFKVALEVHIPAREQYHPTWTVSFSVLLNNINVPSTGPIAQQSTTFDSGGEDRRWFIFDWGYIPWDLSGGGLILQGLSFTITATSTMGVDDSEAGFINILEYRSCAEVSGPTNNLSLQFPLGGISPGH